MTLMGGDQNRVTCAQLQPAAREFEFGTTTQQNRPFRLGLVVPEAGRTDVVTGADMFQPKTRTRRQRRDLFPLEAKR